MKMCRVFGHEVEGIGGNGLFSAPKNLVTGDQGTSGDTKDMERHLIGGKGMTMLTPTQGNDSRLTNGCRHHCLFDRHDQGYPQKGCVRLVCGAILVE